jgi:CheY-like chemotaxis protein
LKRAFENLTNSYLPVSRAYPRKPVILIAGTREWTSSVAAAFEVVREHCSLATSLKDALGKMNLAPAACLIDVTVWDDGWTFMQRIRAGETQNQTPIFVFSTKKFNLEQTREIEKLGIEQRIAKPFNSTAMRRKVMNAILRDALKRGKPLDSAAS